MEKDTPDSINNAEIMVLPLRNNVLFPKIVMPVTLTRAASIETIKQA